MPSAKAASLAGSGPMPSASKVQRSNAPIVQLEESPSLLARSGEGDGTRRPDAACDARRRLKSRSALTSAPGLRPRPLRRPRHPTTFQYLPRLSEASRRCPRTIGMKAVWRLAGNAGDLGARRDGKGKGCGEGGWRREGIPCSVCGRFFRRTDHGGADFSPHHENLQVSADFRPRQ